MEATTCSLYTNTKDIGYKNGVYSVVVSRVTAIFLFLLIYNLSFHAIHVTMLLYSGIYILLCSTK